MPIYEYQCPDCGHRFEKLQKVSDDPVTVCPECGEGGVRKLVSQSAFILKGSGWYKDHYGLKKSAEGGEKAKGKDAGATGAAAPASASSGSGSPASGSSGGSSGSSGGSSGSSGGTSSTSSGT